MIEEDNGKEPKHILEGIKKAKKLSSNDAYNLAKEMIRVYVERGDSIESLKAGHLGCTLGDFVGHGSIGGKANNKNYNTDNIIIELSDNRVFIYKLKNVFNDIINATLF